MDHFHRPPPQNIGRPHHQWIADLRCNRQGLLQGTGHPRFRLRNAQLGHHLSKAIAILRQIDSIRGSPNDVHTASGQFIGYIERSLTTELHNDSLRFFLFVYAENILNRERLKVKFIRCIIVRRYSLGIAVDHDGLKALIPQRESTVHAAVVKFDALTNPVGSPAQHHDFTPVAGFHFIGAAVCGVIVGGVLDTAHGYRLPRLDNAQTVAMGTDIHFRDPRELREITV